MVYTTIFRLLAKLDLKRQANIKAIGEHEPAF